MKISSGTVLQIATFIIVAFFLFWAVSESNNRRTAFTMEEPVKVLNKTIKSGDILDLEISYCLNTTDPVLFKRTLRDHQIINIDETPVPILLDTGCHTIGQQIKVDNAHVDTYTITFYVTIPTKNYGQIFKTEVFSVIE